LVAPKGTPDAIVKKLNEQVGEILAQPETRKKLLALGFDPWHGSPADLQRTVTTEYAKWGDVIKTSGMTAQ
jgi:tripartite-type tricarboxylate transporter receptor subunit TctC